MDRYPYVSRMERALRSDLYRPHLLGVPAESECRLCEFCGVPTGECDLHVESDDKRGCIRP